MPLNNLKNLFLSNTLQKDIFRSNRNSKIKIILVILSCFFVLNYIHTILRLIFVTDNFFDFNHYYAFSELLSKHFNIYNLSNSKINLLAHQLNLPNSFPKATGYSPIIYFLFYPLTILPPNISCLVWVIFNNLILFISIYFLYNLIGNNDFLNLFALLFVAFTFQPIIETIGVGQINILIFFFIILSIHFIYNGKIYLSSIFLAFPVLIKPQYGLLLVFFLWKKQYSLINYTIFNYILLRGLGIIYYGLNIELSYWKELLFLATNKYADSVRGISIKNIIDRIIMGIKKSYISYGQIFYIIISILLTVYSFSKISRSSTKDNIYIKDFSIIICLIAIISPLTYKHHLVLTIIPLLLIINNPRSLPNYKCITLFIISFCLIALKYSLMRFQFFHYGLGAIFTSGKLIGVIFLWWLLNNISLDHLNHIESDS